ncbi:MAG TPA: hypothetical protein VFN35_08320, partial [Ktedonobacteraceae bacterium]|nr:hypothetical protein [Ktedonobacteraceae bacterium]
QLAQDTDRGVREKVAGNPNTSWQSLQKLAREFPRAFLHNPVGPLQLMANQEQVCTDVSFWDALLREPSIPALWWDWLLSHPTLSASQAVRLHVRYAGEVASPYDIPREEDIPASLTLIELFLAVSSQKVPLPAGREFAEAVDAAGEHLMKDHLRWLARESAREVRWALAGNAYTPEDVLTALARNPDLEVRRAVAKNGRASENLLRSLAQDRDAEVRKLVAWHERVSVETLCMLAQDENEEVRNAVAWHECTPVEVLCTLAQDKYEDEDYGAVVRKGVALNERTPVEVLRTLARDADRSVRSSVAENEQTPEDVLRALAQEEREWTRAEVALRKRTPVEVLCTLAQDRESNVRAWAAWNARMPAEMLRVLARDLEGTVRQHAAFHPQMPVEVLHTLARDKDAWVRSAVAWNVQVSPEILSTLAQDKELDVRWAANLVQRLLNEVEKPVLDQGWREKWYALPPIERRTDMHGSAIEDLLLEKQLDKAVRRLVPDAVRQLIITRLAASWDEDKIQSAFATSETDSIAVLRTRREYYRHLAAPYMPPLALQKLATSPSWDVRYLVALHEKTPEGTRQSLCQDGNRYVRAMARAKFSSASRDLCLPASSDGLSSSEG